MNLLLASLPAALAVVYLSKGPLAKAMAGEGRGYDNAAPRAQQARLEGWGARALAAHQNGFEAFPAFGIAVLAAQVTVGPTSLTLGLAWSHVALRVLYVALYLGNRPSMRSTVWGLGFCATLALYVLALLA